MFNTDHSMINLYVIILSLNGYLVLGKLCRFLIRVILKRHGLISTVAR
jgi:hypothetical protein